MEPAIKSGSYIIVNNLAKAYRAGDIVVARHPKKEMLMVKRVESVEGEMLSLVGDNKEESEDSRSFGFVSKGSVIGKVITKIG